MRDTPKGFVAAYNKHGSIKAVCRQEGITWHHARRLYKAAVAAELIAPMPIGRKPREPKPPLPPTGNVYAMRARELPLPPDGMVFKYLFSCVQNDTLIHEDLWRNIQAYMAYQLEQPSVAGCELHVARLTYAKMGLGAVGDKARIVRRETLYGGRDMTFPHQTVQYQSDERLQIAPGLVWCGEVNILPTAVNPLSGFESYTGRKSGIFPHTKVALESIPSMANEGTKFNYTTGALTLRNHIQRKAGLKADFHHCYGFLLAEVNSDGDWWCRPIVADVEGTFYDFELRVKDGVVETGKWIDSIIWGDVHEQILSDEVMDLCWGFPNGIIDQLYPKRQFVHDLLNFTGRNHHEIKDPMTRFRRWREGVDSVKNEIERCSKFLMTVAERPFCETIVVNSNHDRALTRWLKEQDARFDPVNAEFWTDLWRETYVAMCDTGEEPHCFSLAMALVGYEGAANFLTRDASYVVCEDDDGGVECGMHGDEGPNGGRGNIKSYARMGRKIVVAHTHRAGIVDGVYQVGAMCKLRPEYVHGPDAASHTFCIIYENGKRTLVTLWAGRYRA